MDAPTPPPVPAAPSAGPTAPSPFGAAPVDTYATAPYGTAPYGATSNGYSAAPLWAPPVAPAQNVLAWVAFGLGIGSIMFGLLASIPAIVCGHIARRQVVERGEQGAGAALAGLIIGYVMTALFVLGILAYLLFIVVLFGAVSVSSGVPTSL